MAFSSRRSVLWVQVWGLAAVQGSIALTWVIYNLFLPQLLSQFGFPRTLAAGLLIFENLLAAIMEPLMGSFSDRTQRWLGTRFPFIAIGVILAASLFVAIPAITVFGQGWAGAARWSLPIVLVAWSLAMAIFRSPALSLLGRYAFATRLPQAASILTLVGAVTGAVAPLVNDFLLKLGAPIPFTAGSLSLLVAAAALRAVNPPASPANTAKPPTPPIALLPLVFIFGAGAGISIGFRLMMQAFPKILHAQPSSASLILGLIFLTVAITAIPAGTFAVRLGNQKAMLIGLCVMAIGLLLLLALPYPLLAGLLAIGIGAAFSLVSNGTIPFALSLVPAEKAGLGTGMFFSGGAIGLSLFLSIADNLDGTIGAMVGAMAFLLAAGLVALAGNGR
ncbi:MAG TPA: MFS transporter [Trichocoleus sp.]|jgi:MFS family permease